MWGESERERERERERVELTFRSVKGYQSCGEAKQQQHDNKG